MAIEHMAGYQVAEIGESPGTGLESRGGTRQLRAISLHRQCIRGVARLCGAGVSAKREALDLPTI
jgi:hypothetical protein